MDRMTAGVPIKHRERTGSALEVLRAFAKLGVSCFGGPIAHIGYFRQEFVVKRRWLDEQAYADLVALCQFLPGPASSQVGFSLGLMRAGYLGGLAAWVAFTLPSAIALVLFAYGASALEGEIGSGLLHGLKLVAVAIVAQAVWGMARTLCPDRERASIAVVAALVILLSSILRRSDRRHRLRRNCRPLALPDPSSDTLRSRAYVSAGLSASGLGRAHRVLPASRRAAHTR
jgi:chromate transporter